MRFVNKATAWNFAAIVPAMYLPPYKESKIILRSSLRRLLLQSQRSDLSQREAGKLEILNAMLGGPIVIYNWGWFSSNEEG